MPPTHLSASEMMPLRGLRGNPRAEETGGHLAVTLGNEGGMLSSVPKDPPLGRKDAGKGRNQCQSTPAQAGYHATVLPPHSYQVGFLSFSCSIVSDSLQPQGLQPTRLLCPWDSPGKNPGAGCHALLQGIFPTRGSKPRLRVSCTGRQILQCARCD